MSDADATPVLLVVDDDDAIVELVRRYFGLHGFRVVAAADGRAMRAELLSSPVDIVLLDLGLPGEDGLELTRYLRMHWSGPIVIVSGRGDTVDRIVGLELGADDYVTKPFDLRELLARVRSVLRRSQERAAPRPAAGTLRFAGFTLDPASRTLVRADGSTVGLTTGEFDLLVAFVERPNHVLSRDDLIGALHGREAGPYDRSVDMQVGRLRRKIETDPAEPQLIKSVRGAGYLFTAKVERR
ncbi:response regulator transcription factor [Dokdonella sp.]|jgi:DNA-binding response OmpR family regulator|uniref:response regulator transcription factor n=1 Tax=Dokdonella sp. TaxID=2291710 RepID=UPI002F42F529